MSSLFRPMKGEKVTDFSLIKYPVYVSLKLDGIRCLVREGKALTAALKPIPNRYIRNILESDPRYEGFDGELMLRGNRPFNEVSSAVMSADGEPDFVYHVFDLHHLSEMVFQDRLRVLEDRVVELAAFCMCPRSGLQARLVKHILAHNKETLQATVSAVISAGHEGVMLRRPDLPYKFGKASVKQGHLLKVKPVEEMECIVVGFEEGEKNLNEATINERGLTARSSCKEGKVPNGTLGKFIVRNARFGEFKIGNGEGLTHALRAEVWANREKYLHRIIRFKYQEVGTVDKPRSPNWLAFRDEKDLEPELHQELRSLI